MDPRNPFPPLKLDLEAVKGVKTPVVGLAMVRNSYFSQTFVQFSMGFGFNSKCLTYEVCFPLRSGLNYQRMPKHRKCIVFVTRSTTEVVSSGKMIGSRGDRKNKK